MPCIHEQQQAASTQSTDVQPGGTHCTSTLPHAPETFWATCAGMQTQLCALSSMAAMQLPHTLLLLINADHCGADLRPQACTRPRKYAMTQSAKTVWRVSTVFPSFFFFSTSASMDDSSDARRAPSSATAGRTA